ncbi:hypothetical protein D3C87_1894370 [compost metagenome]
MARRWPSSTSWASLFSASIGLPMNCSAAVATSSVELPTLIMATPSAMTGTPCSVYTSGVVTSSLWDSSDMNSAFWKTGRINAPPPRTILILRPDPSSEM